MRDLREQLEAEEAQEWELKRARDVAREAYATVARKATEVDVASSLTPILVRFASPAVEPAAPVPSKSLQKVVLAGVGSFVFAAGIVILVHFMDPDFDPREVLGRLRRAGAS